jgi:hypothetical protein
MADTVNQHNTPEKGEGGGIGVVGIVAIVVLVLAALFLLFRWIPAGQNDPAPSGTEIDVTVPVPDGGDGGGTDGGQSNGGLY